MKTLVTFAVVSLCCYTTVLAAGPVLNATDMAPIGTITQNYQVSSVGKVDPGSSGQNQTWDFSSLQATAFVIVEVIDPSTVPADIAAAIPSANCWEKNNTGTTGSYNAYKLTSTSLAQIAIGAHGNAGSGIKYTRLFSIPTTYFRFPFSYGDKFNDSNKVSAAGAPLITYSLEYDAYGTLITPQGTYTNVLRTKIVSSNNHVVYRWYTSNPCWVLMMNTDSTSVVFYKSQTNSVFYPGARPAYNQRSRLIQNAGSIDLLGRIQTAGSLENLPAGIFLNRTSRKQLTLKTGPW